MLVRSLPIFAGIAPIIGVTCAYLLGVSYDVLPSCMPLIDGCTSISATGRNMPGRLVFRSVMFPQSVLLIVLWYLGARWIRDMTPSRFSAVTVTVSGCIGALALVVYVATLGTRTPLYDFMRRFGVYFYFLGTAVAQVTLAVTLLAHAKRTMAMSLHLYVVTFQVPDVPEALPYGVALVLVAMVLGMNSVSIAFRTYLRGKKKW